MFSGPRRALWLTPLLGLCACSSLSVNPVIGDADLAVTPILNNCDDDDRDGLPDNADEIVNGPDDVADLTAIEVTLPRTSLGLRRATLSLSPGAIDRLRVFQRTGAENALPLADGSTLDLGAREGRTITLLVEAKQFADADWNGLASIAVTTQTRMGTTERRSALLRVAPWILLPATQPGEVLWVREFPERNDAFLEDLEEVVPAAGMELVIIPGDAPYPAHNIWLQDAIEIGFTAVPQQMMHAVLNSNRNKGLDMVARDHLLGPGIGWFQCGEFREEFGAGEGDNSWIDWFGNLEISPPVEGYPFGRAYVGHNPDGPEGAQMNPEVVALIDAQDVQGPVLLVDVGYLLIKHADEVLCWVPTGDREHPVRLLMPDSELMIAMLDEWIEAGLGDTPMLTTYKEDMTIASIRGDEELIAHNRATQRRIDAVRAQAIEEFGLREQDVIGLPTLHELDGRALVPNVINSVVANGYFLAPRQDGPVVEGEDLIEARVREMLADLPLEIRFLDDEQYQRWCGNVHCATNVLRTPFRASWWDLP